GWPSIRGVPLAVFGAGAVEAFGEAAFLLEALGEAVDLAVEQGAGDADEHVRGVGGGLLAGGGSIASIRSIVSIAELLHPEGDLVGVGASARHKPCAAGIDGGPQGQAALAQEVLVVELEL